MTRTGLRRARVLVALRPEGQSITKLVKGTSLKYVAVEDILDALSRHNLVQQTPTGAWQLAATPEAAAAQAEARARLDAQAVGA